LAEAIVGLLVLMAVYLHEVKGLIFNVYSRRLISAVELEGVYEEVIFIG